MIHTIRYGRAGVVVEGYTTTHEFQYIFYTMGAYDLSKKLSAMLKKLPVNKQGKIWQRLKKIRHWDKHGYFRGIKVYSKYFDGKTFYVYIYDTKGKIIKQYERQM